MFCGQCGAQNPDNTRFCGKCGAPVMTMPVQRAAQQQYAPQQVGSRQPAHARHAAPAQPTYQQPAYQEPAYQQPTYQQPVYQQPAYQEPVTQPAYPEQSQPRYATDASNQGSKRPATRLIVPILVGVGVMAALVVAAVVFVIPALRGGGGSAPASPSLPEGVSSFFNAVGGVLVFVFLGIFVVCAFKESATTGLYKAFGVYGRIRAYLFTDFALAGIMSFITVIGAPFGLFDAALDNVMGSIFVALGCSVGAVLIYLSTYSRCPDMLKSKLLISMLISGCGISMKICVFFLGIVWAMTGPREMVDESGRTIYVYDGSVYDGGGNKVGVLDPDNSNRYIRYE